MTMLNAVLAGLGVVSIAVGIGLYSWPAGLIALGAMVLLDALFGDALLRLMGRR